MNLVEQVTAWLARQSISAYLVGGCVRDYLLSRSIVDLDVAVDGDGLGVARRLANHFGGAYHPLDEARSTGRAILHDESGSRLVVDVARFRGSDLATDLADRDFTINALAADVRAPDEVIDHHNGLHDLKAGLLRPVSEASIRNDPLRALRAVRLAAELSFVLHSETDVLIQRHGPALSRVAGERIRDELARLLALSEASPHLRRLDDLGLLAVVLPELEPLRGLAQPSPHHLDVLAHSLETVHSLEEILCALEGIRDGQRTSEDLEDMTCGGQLSTLEPFSQQLISHLDQMMGAARPRLVTLKLAALLHDTGKPAARTLDEDGRIRFLGHARKGARITGRALQRLRFNRSEVRLGEALVRQHMRPLLLANQRRVSSRAVYRFFRDAGRAGVDVLLLALADHRATYAPGADGDPWPRLVASVVRMLGDYWERHAERVDPCLLIDGYDLLREFRLQPGPRIGELLELVREGQVSGEVRSREEALAMVRGHLDQEC